MIEKLGLQPHPEGGWFRETWRTEVTFTSPEWDGPRATATGILYLLRPGERSAWHRLRGDELWLWHRGGPLLLSLGGSADAPDGSPNIVKLGPDIERNQLPQVLVPGGHWQSAQPAEDQEVLVSCVVSPGFSYPDFELFK